MRSSWRQLPTTTCQLHSPNAQAWLGGGLPLQKRAVGGVHTLNLLLDTAMSDSLDFP